MGSSAEISTRIFRTDGGLRVEDFLPARATPGDVGVCFSGGGTRSMVATTGQLRALKHLGLLARTKAILAVSGGAWAAVPFSYLPADRDEDALLGRFVADPRTLHLGPGDAEDPADLAAADPGALVRVPTHRAMDLAAAAAWILWWMQPVHLGKGVDVDRLWTSYVTLTILGTLGFDVHEFSGRVSPAASFFCWDPAQEEALRREVPGLPEAAFHVEPGGAPGRCPRPFPVISTAMLVHANHQEEEELFRFLAPVHATPFFTGVVSTPEARDDWRERGWFRTTLHEGPVGGGGPSSFAFDGQLLGLEEDRARVVLDRVFSLPDVVSATSCVFAERLRTHLVDTKTDYRRGAILEALESILEWVGGPAVSVGFWTAAAELHRAHQLAPSHRYWSPRAETGGLPTPFADGGSMDNVGVASLLAYEDVHRVVVFVNAGSALGRTQAGVVLDDPVPTLFGLRGEAGSYAPFPPIGEHGDDELAQRRFNQVFETRRFDELREGLLAAWENSPEGTAVFLQPGLRVLPNSWYGVRGHRTVDVLWVYLNRSQAWREQLEDPAVAAVADEPWFPHWNTWKPAGSLAQANLLAHYTAWVAAGAAGSLRELYAGAMVPFGPPGAVRFHDAHGTGLPGPYDAARAFREGRAAARLLGANGWCYLDTRGEVVAEGPFLEAGDFSEGFAWVRDPGGSARILDRAGRTSLATGGDGDVEEILSAREGVATVRVAGALAFLDLRTRAVARVAPGGEAFAELRGFRNGWAAVRLQDGRWGFLGRDLESWAAAPEIREVLGDYSEGRALVRAGTGELAYLSAGAEVHHLRTVTGPAGRLEVRMAGGYRDGRARVSDGIHSGFLDLRGVLVVAPRPGEVGEYSSRRVAVRAPGEVGWSYLDPAGEVALAEVEGLPIAEAGPFRRGLAVVRPQGQSSRLLVTRSGEVVDRFEERLSS